MTVFGLIYLRVIAERELKELLGRSGGERPWQVREELGSSMLENFGVFRREEQMQNEVEIIEKLRHRYENVVVEDKGGVFNSDLTQAIELGYCLDLAACMVQAGVARKESRGAHARRLDRRALGGVARATHAHHPRDPGARCRTLRHG